MQSKQQTETQADTQSSRTPEQFDISDDELEEETPTSIPQYDLTDDKFNVLRGKLDQDHIDMLRERYAKTVKLGKHLQQQPSDNDAKAEQTFYRESLARRIAQLRLDKKEHDLDKTCVKLLDELEKTACVSNRMRKRLPGTQHTSTDTRTTIRKQWKPKLRHKRRPRHFLPYCF